VLLRAGDEPVGDAVARLEAIPGVAMAEPNQRVDAAFVPDDPLYTHHSGYLEQINAPAAWDLQTGDPAVKVAVLDSGIDLDHTDLAGAVWSNEVEVAGNGVDDDDNGCVDDINGC